LNVDPLGGEGAMVAAMDEPGAVVTEIARSLHRREGLGDLGSYRLSALRIEDESWMIFSSWRTGTPEKYCGCAESATGRDGSRWRSMARCLRA